MASQMPGRSFVTKVVRRVGRELTRFRRWGEDSGSDEAGRESGRIRISEETFFRDEDRFVEASQQGKQVIVTDGNGGTRMVLGTSPESPFPDFDLPQVENGGCPVDDVSTEEETSSWLT